MPYNTIWEKRGVMWRFYGDVTAEEISNANDEFYTDERSDRTRYQIIDALQVTSVEWTEQDISVTAAYDIGADRIIKNVKVAYVANDEEIISKLEKYIEISIKLNSSWQFRGFTELQPAKRWVAE